MTTERPLKPKRRRAASGQTQRRPRANAADPTPPPAYAVRLPHALVQRLDRYLDWQRQHAGADTAVFRSRAQAARWLLSWAIDALVRAHEDCVAAKDLSHIFAQSPSHKSLPTPR